jgi:hypothetical protein
MRIPIMKIDDMLEIKANLDQYAYMFVENNPSWIENELGHSPFVESKYEIPSLNLVCDQNQVSSSDFENVKEVYGKLSFLSASQASDERLWAGLCMGPCWEYVQKRWDIKENPNAGSIKQHYFFDGAARRALTRNALARLWWIGRLTFDANADRGDPFEMTEFVCRNSRFIVDILERNTSNNLNILKPFLHAAIDSEKQGTQISSENMRALEKYMDLLGGVYLLDCMPYDFIYTKMKDKIEQIC